MIPTTQERAPIAANLRELKERKGCTWREIAAAVDSPERNVAEWANPEGRFAPSWPKIVLLAAYFELPDPGMLYLQEIPA